MKKATTLFVCLLAFCMVQAQTVSKSTVDQYRQLVKMSGQSFTKCSGMVEQWGFTHNKDGIMDLFTMQTHPYFRAEGTDTVGVMLGVIDDVVCSQSGVYSSTDPTHTYALIAQGSAIQQELATAMGLTKYVCSIKGKVSNKFPKNQEELVEVLKGATAETVKQVYESWKSADGKTTLTLVYDNHLYNKKKPRSKDRAELILGIGTVPEN